MVRMALRQSSHHWMLDGYRVNCEMVGAFAIGVGSARDAWESWKLEQLVTRWWIPNDKPNGYAVLAGSYPRVV